MEKKQLKEIGNKNKLLYETTFSNELFAKKYVEVINDMRKL